MKASQVGISTLAAVRVLDHFEHVYNWRSYIAVKYEGLFPPNMPTKAMFHEVNTAINYHRSRGEYDQMAKATSTLNRMNRVVRSVQRDWRKQQ